VREGLARQLLFRAGERARGLAVGEDDPVARERPAAPPRRWDRSTADEAPPSRSDVKPAAENVSTLRANETNPSATVPRVSATSATITSLFATRFTGIDSAIRMPLSRLRAHHLNRLKTWV
jgi:hypothetical protein